MQEINLKSQEIKEITRNHRKSPEIMEIIGNHQKSRKSLEITEITRNQEIRKSVCSPLVVVQEEGSYKVFVYLSIPELKLKRSFLNFFKFLPSNGYVKVLDFQNQ